MGAFITYKKGLHFCFYRIVWADQKLKQVQKEKVTYVYSAYGKVMLNYYPDWVQGGKDNQNEYETNQ
jgi:hypothetical protein